MNKELEYYSKRVAKGLMDRRSFMGKALALGATTTMATGLLSTAAMAEGPKKGGKLTAGMQGGASSDKLDPATWLSDVQVAAGFMFGEALFDPTPNGELDYRLAKSAESSPDAKIWSIEIRQGIEFHNGKTLTPEDVVATLERHKDPETGSGAAGIVAQMETIRVDGSRVEIGLTDANADLPFLLSNFNLVIQPNGGKDDPNAPIGTGPYRVTGEEPGVRYSGERFENYWDDGRGHADEVEVLVLNDPTARIAALQSGRVDIVNRVEPKTVSLMDRIPGVTIQNVAGRGHYVFIMHADTAPFDNNDLRLALKYAINREELVEKILQGYGSVGNDFPINAPYPLFPEGIEQRSYDPDKAAFHYKKSGHEGPIVLRTSDVAFPGAVDATQLFQQSAAAAGINLEIKREPGDGYWSDVWNVQPFCASYWGGAAVQDQMYSQAYLSTADWNDTRFKREDFDKLIIAARGELDRETRQGMYRDAALMVRNEGGLILPMFNDFIDATGPRVGGWEGNGNAGMMYVQALIKCWVMDS